MSPTKPADAVDRWSQQVTETSDAMDLKHDVFKQHDPEAIARSLKSSAEHSDRRKSDPFRSAMSMLTFYINRAGRNLPTADHQRLEAAKDALRTLFDRPAARRTASTDAKRPGVRKAEPRASRKGRTVRNSKS